MWTFYEPKHGNSLPCDGLKRRNDVFVFRVREGKAKTVSRGREIFPSGKILVTESRTAGGVRTIQKNVSDNNGEVAERSKAAPC